MAVGHLRLRKIALLLILIVLVGAVVAASILTPLDVYKIVGLSIIAVILFFNVSRRIYPARRILNGEPDVTAQGQSAKKEDEGKFDG